MAAQRFYIAAWRVDDEMLVVGFSRNISEVILTEYMIRLVAISGS